MGMVERSVGVLAEVDDILAGDWHGLPVVGDVAVACRGEGLIEAGGKWCEEVKELLGQGFAHDASAFLDGWFHVEELVHGEVDEDGIFGLPWLRGSVEQGVFKGRGGEVG